MLNYTDTYFLRLYISVIDMLLHVTAHVTVLFQGIYYENNMLPHVTANFKKKYSNTPKSIIFIGISKEVITIINIFIILK